MAMISALRRPRQKSSKFKVSLHYIVLILAQSQTKQTTRVTEAITVEMNKGNGSEFARGRRTRIKVSLC